jgi:hypothetical protein
MSDEMLEQVVDNGPFIPEEIYKINWTRLFKIEAKKGKRFNFKKDTEVSGYVIFDILVKAEKSEQEESKEENKNEKKEEPSDYCVFKGRINGSRTSFRIDFDTCKIALETGILRPAKTDAERAKAILSGI